jgi:coenzyme F420-reducing hydrogenase beta subunit
LAESDIAKSIKIFEDKKKTVQDIHDKGYCNYCGACKLICPVDAIEYSGGKVRVTNDCILCGKCLDICSQNHQMKFSSKLAERENNHKIKKYNKRMKHVPFGEFRDIFITETLSPNVKETAMVGGSTLSILATALDISLIDTALVTDFEKDSSFPSGVLVKSEKQLLKTGGSKYLPTLSLEKLNEILLDDDIESVAITTLPCQAYALEKMKENPDTAKFTSKIKLVLTLLCGSGLPNREDINKYLKKKGIIESINDLSVQRKKIKRFWRLNPQDQQRYIYTSKKGNQYDISSRRILASKSKRNCRRLCPDYSGYYSDLSIGGSGLKSNIVVIRTQLGEKVFQETLGRKNIKKRKFTSLNYFLINFMGKKKRKANHLRYQQLY